MAFSDSFLSELTARSEISDIVSEYVTLTPKGQNLWGLCPFHSEKTPSFAVSRDKQIYHCFGCGKGGGVINFVMEMENFTFPEAVEHLAKRAGMELPEQSEGAGRGKRERILALNREAALFFHHCLHTPEGEAGREYFASRGLRKGTITRFGLGVAPDGWDGLIRAMAEKGYEKGDLLDAGLAVRNKNGSIYDRFRGRVMFPIIDVRGAVIGFGGRVLGEGSPKYLNSPDTPVFNKSRNLFGLNYARKSRRGYLILTEGYMDTIALHQAGFDCAVASLGTALTADHARLLARYTKEAVIAYDGDGAGTAAAQRAISILGQTEIAVKVLRIRDAKDPDEFIGKFGPAAFERLVTQSDNHVEYRLNRIAQGFDLSSDEGKIGFAQEAAVFLATLSNPVEREVYTARAAERAGITPGALTLEVERARKKRERQAKRQEERKILTPAVSAQPMARSLRYDNIKSARAEEGVITLLFAEPELLERSGELREELFSSPFLGRVYREIAGRIREGKELSLPVLSQMFSAEEISHLSAILSRPAVPENRSRAMRDYIEIMMQESRRREEGGDADPLLLAQRAYQEKKGYKGAAYEREAQ